MSDMEEFASLMEVGGWDSSTGLSIQSDDQEMNMFSTPDVKQSRMVDIFHDVLESPVSDVGDQFSEDWMELTSLSQMLGELSGMAVDQTSLPSSLVKDDLVTNLDFADESVFTDLGLDQDGFELLQQLVEKATEIDSGLHTSLEDSVTPIVSIDNELPEITEVTEVISLDDSGIVSLDTSLLEDSSAIDFNDVNVSHTSASEVESLFSSAPVSPSSSISSSDCSSELYKLMTQPVHNHTSTPKSTPYSSPNASLSRKTKVKSVSTDNIANEFLSKKEKKKLQNKNAAIRYRQKKKVEADVTKQEEDALEETNQKLHEKADEIQREILYMKNLMSEVYKARGSVKITKVTISG